MTAAGLKFERTKAGLEATKLNGTKLGREYQNLEALYRFKTVKRMMLNGISKTTAYRLAKMKPKFTFWGCTCGNKQLSYEPFIPKCCNKQMTKIKKQEYDR